MYKYCGRFNGSALAGSATSLLSMAGKYLEPVAQGIQIIVMLIDVLKPDDKVEELGAKAIEENKKAEDFDSDAEYIDYLRDDVKLDKKNLTRRVMVKN